MGKIESAKKKLVDAELFLFNTSLDEIRTGYERVNLTRKRSLTLKLASIAGDLDGAPAAGKKKSAYDFSFNRDEAARIRRGKYPTVAKFARYLKKHGAKPEVSTMNSAICAFERGRSVPYPPRPGTTSEAYLAFFAHEYGCEWADPGKLLDYEKIFSSAESI